MNEKAGGRNSPLWDIEEASGEPSTTAAVGRHEPGEEKGGLPPLVQSEVVKVEPGGADGRELVLQSNNVLGGKSTPSTLSDSPDEERAGEEVSGKLLGQSGVTSKKRVGSKGRESEDQETSEEGQDAKRKPRKSARLA